jgi:hypothetical protein
MKEWKQAAMFEFSAVWIPGTLTQREPIVAYLDDIAGYRLTISQ